MVFNTEHRSDVKQSASGLATETRNVIEMPNATRPAFSYPTLPYYPYIPYYQVNTALALAPYDPANNPLQLSQQYDHPIPGPPGSNTWFYPIPTSSVAPAVAAPLPQVFPPSAFMFANYSGDGPTQQATIEDLPDQSITPLQSVDDADAASETDEPDAPVDATADEPVARAAEDMYEHARDLSPPTLDPARSAGSTTQVATGQKRALEELDLNTSLAQTPADDDGKPPTKRRRPRATAFSYADLDALTVFVDIRKPVDDDEWKSVGEAFNEWAVEKGRFTREWKNLRGKWKDLCTLRGVPDRKPGMEKRIARAKRIEEQIRSQQALMGADVGDDEAVDIWPRDY